MTILLSKLANQDHLPQRKIQIKPIKQIEKESTNTSSEEEPMIESDRLMKLKEEIRELEEVGRSKRIEIQSTIEKEKESWKEEKKRWIEEAKQEGFQAGFKSGETKSLTQYKTLLDEANHIVDLVKIDYQKTLERTDDMIIDLAIHTAEKILDKKLTETPENFIEIVKAALKAINDQKVISIYLHPTDYETVLLQKGELKRIVENDTKLSLYINDELHEGDCIIEHPFGRIDASVDTQLGEIRNALRELILEQD